MIWTSLEVLVAAGGPILTGRPTTLSFMGDRVTILHHQMQRGGAVTHEEHEQVGRFWQEILRRARQVARVLGAVVSEDVSWSAVALAFLNRTGERPHLVFGPHVDLRDRPLSELTALDPWSI